jgi:hypothetical protein
LQGGVQLANLVGHEKGGWGVTVLATKPWTKINFQS